MTAMESHRVALGWILVISWLCFTPAAHAYAQDFVRLVNFLNATSPGHQFEGRVEVYHNGEWGTICDNEWSYRDATVACRMAGFYSAVRPVTGGHYGPGEGRVWLNYVDCDGTDWTLDACVYGNWGTDDPICNQHTKDAGVVCSKDLAIRLVDGPVPNKGRVEVYHRGQWGTICDNSWGIQVARVVCRQLGYADATGFRVAGYGQGRGPIWMSDLDCTGNESRITDCHFTGWDSHNCGHNEDISVDCTARNFEQPYQPARFVISNLTSNNTEGLSYGKVEIWNGTTWGTVCDDGWDIVDANVVCRQLGFIGAFSDRDNAEPGTGQSYRPIFYDQVNCSGAELALSQCNRSAVRDCGHYKDAGVVCQSPYRLPGNDVRLVAGSSSMEGRVEISHDGVWGTVCNHFWGADDAQVVCDQLGFFGNASTEDSWKFPPGSNYQPIWIDNVNCNGTESYLSECPNRGWGVHSCFHWDDAGVICQASNYSIPVRLVNGSRAAEGRVEINYNGKWGTICDFAWGIADASVVCRQLGYIAATDAVNNSFFGAGNRPLLASSIGCSRDDPQLANCSGFQSEPFVPDFYCDETHVAGVRCQEFENYPPPIRLVDGSSRNEGRVELYLQGQWGTICDDSWDDMDAMVVCQQLGYPSSGALAVSFAHFDQGAGPIVLDDVECNGLELYITDCPRSGYYNHNCRHAEDVGVCCPTRPEGSQFSHPIRLSINDGTALGSNEGIVEISYNGTWGTICFSHWDFSESQVACRMLGYTTASAVRFDDYLLSSGGGRGLIALYEVECTGGEFELADCLHGNWGEHDEYCRHVDDVGISCIMMCASIALSAHLQASGGNTAVHVGSEIHFSCDNGYNINGSKTTTCLQSGQWSNAVPHCVQSSTTCPSVVLNTHLHVQASDGNIVGSEIHFFCENAYYISGSSTITCLQGGQWSDEVPHCVQSTEPTTGPISKPTTSEQPTGSVTGRPTSQPTGPTSEQPAGPTSEQPTGPTSEQPTGPTSEQPTRPTSEQPAGPTSEQPTSEQPTSEQPTGPTSEQPTGPTSEQTTGPTSEQPTGPTSEQPTGPTSEQPTGPTSEQPTGPTSEQPTGSTTERPTSEQPTKRDSEQPTSEQSTEHASEQLTGPTSNKSTSEQPTGPGSSAQHTSNDKGPKIGPIVGGAVGGIFAIIIVIIATSIIVWKVAFSYGRKHGYGRMSVRVEEERVNLSPKDNDNDDEPLYNTDDV